jgi:hypothetical protein
MSSRYFMIFCVLLIAYNATTLTSQHLQRQSKPSQPLHSLGYKFIGLEQLFKDVRYVGYYTDKDIEAPLTIAQFEQAQYMLAPTVLVLNKTDYPFVIFDCTTPEVALNKIRELGLQPLKINAGIILAKK